MYRVCAKLESQNGTNRLSKYRRKEAGREKHDVINSRLYISGTDEYI